jgi:hypothetical protein
MPLTHDHLRDALTALGDLLDDRGTPYDLVLIGGGALVLLGLTSRATKDLDVVALANPNAWLPASPLPKPLAAAILDVAAAFELAPDWLNPGPTDLLQFGLPPGFAERTIIERFGALTVRYASRVDQVALKLYAAADHWPAHNKHLQDLLLLAPTPTELTTAAAWCLSHDPSPGFRNVQLRPLLDHLGAP